MTDVSNYGVKIGTSATGAEPYVDIAGLVKLDAPKLKNSAVDSTNHGSGGVAEKVSSGLVEVDDIKATFSFVESAMTTLTTACTAGTLMHFKITFPNTQTWTFNGFITEFAPAGADAGSPELLTADVTIAVTGAMTIA